MSEVKEVKVALSEADSKALLGGGSGKSRRRRTRKATNEAPAPIEETAAPATAPEIIKIGGASNEPISPLAPVPPTIPPVVLPAVSSTSVVGGGGLVIPAGTVNIKPKNSLAAPTAPAANLARILPTKKRPMNAPAAATLKKPRLIVEPAVPTPPAAPAAQTRRKFRERSIKITVKPTATSRKFRKTLKSRVDSMPIAAVRRILIRKGVMKARVGGAADPPPEMMRSMLKDYLMLNANEA
jgi:histone H3/H4